MLLIILFKLLSAYQLSGDLWYHEILKYVDNFEDALKIGQVNRELIPFLIPIQEIQRNCNLNNIDVWPVDYLMIRGNPNQHCLDLLRNHSHLYQAASITVPKENPLDSRRLLKVLKPNELKIIFPYYCSGTYRDVRFCESINSTQLSHVLESIPTDKQKRISIILRY